MVPRRIAIQDQRGLVPNILLRCTWVRISSIAIAGHSARTQGLQPEIRDFSTRFSVLREEEVGIAPVSNRPAWFQDTP